jgi:cysteine synthase
VTCDRYRSAAAREDVAGFNSLSSLDSLAVDIDNDAYQHSVKRFHEEGIALPTFAQLAAPSSQPASIRTALGAVGADQPHRLNLWRVHWHNTPAGEFIDVPEHLVLPTTLTGVDAPIVVVLGNRFPMIGSHKVLAAYGCLAPRIITGRFDPTCQRAVWPSTGNYARGGVAISRIMGCRGIAVLPEQMSRARFDWLERWVVDPADIVRTPGSESNVKEIYDACAELAKDPSNVIVNQFAEFGNHLAHWLVTGNALERVVSTSLPPGCRPAAFVSATGSAGTLGAGDYLKDRCGVRIVAVEALECPTMLYNGFGEHNIQGIGDKHIPLIHNVTNTDIVTAVSDRSTDALDVLFNTPSGRSYLVDRAGVPAGVVSRLGELGLSSICNVVASIKVAKRLRLGPEDAILTVATDGSVLYDSERAARLASRWPGGFDSTAAAAVFGEHLAAVTDDHVLELSEADRNRIFNLGYFTWVEQQGVGLVDFEARRDQRFWRSLHDLLPEWDQQIREFNGRTGAVPPP